MTQVAILTRTLNGVVGGVEKMVLSLAKGLTEEGHKVTVISLDSLDSKAYFEWPIGVDWEKLYNNIYGKDAQLPKKNLRPHQTEALNNT